MNRVKSNIVANLLSQVWSSALALGFIPLYIRFMGIESFGLVGFYAALQNVLGVLDFGLSPSMNREMARYAAQPEKAKESRDLVRTLEVGYWGLGIVIGIMVLLVAPGVAQYWIKADKISVAVLQQTLVIMGIVTALQWPLSFYQGGLLGLQRQVQLSSLNSVMATIRGVGSVLVLWLFSPTITAYFMWQIVVSALQTILTMFTLWYYLPKSEGLPRFRGELLRSVWRFAAGMSANGILNLFTTQMDKIILSNMLSLEMFGYYSLAWAIASAMPLLTGPIITALFPKFSEMVVAGGESKLVQLYHLSCQLISVIIIPLALILILFSQEIILLWTRNPETVHQTYQIVAVLVVGMAFAVLGHVPYIFQWAHGIVRPIFYINAIVLIVMSPLFIFMILRYGGVGAAAVWAAFNGGILAFTIPVMHRRLLVGEQWRWYIEDVGFPLLVSLPIALMGRWLIPVGLPPLGMAIYISIVALCVFAVTAMSAPQVRSWGLTQIVLYQPASNN